MLKWSLNIAVFWYIAEECFPKQLSCGSFIISLFCLHTVLSSMEDKVSMEISSWHQHIQLWLLNFVQNKLKKVTYFKFFSSTLDLSWFNLQGLGGRGIGGELNIVYTQATLDILCPFISISEVQSIQHLYSL